jgi:Helix-hairpin-helix motif
MRRWLATLLCLLGSVWMLPAQIDSSTVDDGINQVIEDAVIDSENDNQTDWTFLTDQINDLRERPLNLNTATKEELLMVPGMTEILANSLLDYIHQFGNLTSLYELQAVPGFDVALFNRMKLYTQVREAQAKDISPNTLHPAGPPIGTMLKEAKQELLVRWVTDIEQEKGYLKPDTNSNGTIPAHYLGDRNKAYLRYRMRYNQNLSVALVGEKDQGEPVLWDPQHSYYGVDFTSFHVAVKNFGHVKNLVVGDYNIQAGQGMLLSTGLGFGKGSEAINSIKRQNLGIRPYASVNENQFMRGAAGTVAFGDFYATGFFSYIGRDANISVQDTFTDDVILVSSLQTTGFHRTTAEIEDKDAIFETAYGGRVEYKKRWLNLGATQYFQHFSSSIEPAIKDYNRYDFRGNKNYLTGVDFDITVRNFNFFGEIGRSQSGGIGMIGGLLGSIHPKVDVALLGRNFSRDFHSFRGYVFAERPTSLANERGLYMGIKIMPTTKWTFSSFYDQFIFPWNGFSNSYPTWAHEFMAQLQFQPSREMMIYLRLRSDNKQTNSTDLPLGQQIDQIVPTHKESIRLHFQYKVHRNLTIRTRLEHALFTRGYKNALQEESKGFIMYQDLSYKLGYKWDFTARYAIFDSPSFSSRIYAYENDLLGVFNIPAYYGIGSRYYLMVNYKPNKRLEFWARYSISKYQYDRTLGSGLSEIQGDRRSDFKLQMMVRF